MQKPSIYEDEIQQKLLDDGICEIDSLPAKSTINKAIRKKLDFTWKKVVQIPAERSDTKVNEFLEKIWETDPNTIHCFDESSVIRTTGNRTYGHGYRGHPAVEVQRYASNANYTVNLLHSMRGVDYFNVLLGPSNGVEMILFFDEAINAVGLDGLPVFQWGDCVILDNCGFHHGRQTEREMRELLEDRGVNLIFQPPYSPHFNTCEFCFRKMKTVLRANNEFTYQFTELAIINAIETIDMTESLNYFKNCGYLV